MTKSGTTRGATRRTAHSRLPGSRVRSTNHAPATPNAPQTGVATSATSAVWPRRVNDELALTEVAAAETPPWRACTTVTTIGTSTIRATTAQVRTRPRGAPPARFRGGLIARVPCAAGWAPGDLKCTYCVRVGCPVRSRSGACPASPATCPFLRRNLPLRPDDRTIDHRSRQTVVAARDPPRAGRGRMRSRADRGRDGSGTGRHLDHRPALGVRPPDGAGRRVAHARDERDRGPRVRRPVVSRHPRRRIVQLRLGVGACADPTTRRHGDGGVPALDRVRPSAPPGPRRAPPRPDVDRRGADGAHPEPHVVPPVRSPDRGEEPRLPPRPGGLGCGLRRAARDEGDRRVPPPRATWSPSTWRPPPRPPRVRPQGRSPRRSTTRSRSSGPEPAAPFPSRPSAPGSTTGVGSSGCKPPHPEVESGRQS